MAEGLTAVAEEARGSGLALCVKWIPHRGNLVSPVYLLIFLVALASWWFDYS